MSSRITSCRSYPISTSVSSVRVSHFKSFGHSAGCSKSYCLFSRLTASCMKCILVSCSVLSDGSKSALRKLQKTCILECAGRKHAT